MRSADSSMLIILQMHSKLKRVHNTSCVYFFLNIDFQRSKAGSTFTEKRSGNNAVYNYKNDNFVITRGRENVTSESTPSGLLNS